MMLKQTNGSAAVQGMSDEMTDPDVESLPASRFTPQIPRPTGIVALAYMILALAWFPLVSSVLRRLNCRVPAYPGDVQPLYSIGLTVIAIACWLWVQHRSTMHVKTRSQSFVVLMTGLLAIGLVPIALLVVSPITPYVAAARIDCGTSQDDLIGLALYLPLLSLLVTQLINPAGTKPSLMRWIIAGSAVAAIWSAYVLIVQPWPPAGP
ncbi:hypothetical protein [Plantibacter sp. M259]|uniref:hypothetical protein n=1 Tax=Plantibacter sp. M259 TaxID=2583822 RepID=UPI00111007D4|nr:hypothetical protein [Plantibacter sp. M259]